jgi:hypothetical protein
LAEAKKKKEMTDKAKKEVHPAGYSYSEAFDFSAPLGAYNLYRSQGAVNWGPMTGPGTKIDDRIAGGRSEMESALRSFIKEAIRQETNNDSSWTQLSELVNPKPPKFGNVWEAAMHWYDHQGFGLGHATSEGIEEKKKKQAKKDAKK